MKAYLLGLLSAATAGAVLCGCGGGGGGGFASAQPPVVAPAPAPSPGPSPLPARLGLASNLPFATVYASTESGTDENFGEGRPPRSDQNIDLEIRYLATSNTYELALPGLAAGRLEPYFTNGSATSGHIIAPAGVVQPAMDATLFVPEAFPYSYTSFGYWRPPEGTLTPPDETRNQGVFAYGISTAAGDVPTTGQASFSAVVRGYIRGGPADTYEVTGSARLLFDLAGGNLTGSLNPIVPESGWAGFDHDLGHYDFKQTVFEAGSTSFSGKFIVPSLPNADSSFSGVFTGPGAAELMARFEAPFVANEVSGTLVGVWVGKRD